MEGSLNAVYVTLWKTDSGILSFSYFRTTEQNKFGFVQFDRPKIENHLLTPESYESKKHNDSGEKHSLSSLNHYAFFLTEMMMGSNSAYKIFDWQIAQSRACFVPLYENKKI